MEYLKSFSQYAWRFLLIMFVSVEIFNVTNVEIQGAIQGLSWLLGTNFIAWIWYQKRVVEVEAAIIIEEAIGNE